MSDANQDSQRTSPGSWMSLAPSKGIAAMPLQKTGRSLDWRGAFTQEYPPLLSLVRQALQTGQGVAMDLEIQQPFLTARIVYDLFHIVARFGREAIDHVMGDQSNRLKQDKPARQIVRRSRWCCYCGTATIGSVNRLSDWMNYLRPLISFASLLDERSTQGTVACTRRE